MTGASGYLGGLVAAALLRDERVRIVAPVRARRTEAWVLASVERALGKDAPDRWRRRFEIVTLPTQLGAVQEALKGGGFPCESAEISMVPSTTVALEGTQAESMLALMEALEDLDDVQNVYANFDISDDEIARLS